MKNIPSDRKLLYRQDML